MTALIIAIVVRIFTDISFKMAVHQLSFSSAHAILPNIKRLIQNPFTWAGLFFGLINVVAWTVSLQSLDLSYAYPFLSISYIAIILSGKVLFKEHIGKYKIIGITFIGLGAAALFM